MSSRVMLLVLCVLVLSFSSALAQVPEAFTERLDSLMKLQIEGKWDELMFEAEKKAAEMEKAGDREGLIYVYPILASAYHELGRFKVEKSIMAKFSLIYYDLHKDDEDPSVRIMANLRKGQALLLSSKPDEAIKLIDTIIPSIPADDFMNHQCVLNFKAEALNGEGKAREAVVALSSDASLQQKLADTDPSNRYVHLYLAGVEYIYASNIADLELFDRKAAGEYGKLALQALKMIPTDAKVKYRIPVDSQMKAMLKNIKGIDPGKVEEMIRRTALEVPIFEFIKRQFLSQAMASSGDYAGALKIDPDPCQVNNPVFKGTIVQARRFEGLAKIGYWEDRAGHADDAIASYAQSLEAVEDTWTNVRFISKESYFDPMKRTDNRLTAAYVCERLIQLLLEKNQPEKALEFSEKFKSRALLDIVARNADGFPSSAGSELRDKEKRLYSELQQDQENLSKMNSGASDALQPPVIPPSQDSQEAQSVSVEDAERRAGLFREYKEVIGQIREQDPEYASLIAAPAISSAEIQTMLDRDTALIEYFIGAQSSAVFVVTSDRIEGMQIEAGNEAISNAVRKLRKDIQKLTAPDDLRESQRKLGSLIIDPVLGKLSGKKCLVIIPHGPLHYTPFAALTDSEGRCLIESYEITTAPSAYILRFCKEKNDRRREKFDLRGMPSVTFALGSFRPPLKDLSPLPGTSEEARLIKAELPGLNIFEGVNMTTGAVNSNIPGSRIIHFATHGLLESEDPMASSLMLADGEMTVRNIYSLKLGGCYSVTLSACKTALGHITSGDDVIGLTRGFLYAGTPAVISTLWSISDEHTAKLMASFYRHLSTCRRSEALRQAQLEMLRSGSQPFYWGAFVITGDWE